MRNLIKVILGLSLFYPHSQLLAQTVPTADLISATQIFVQEGGERVDELIGVIAANGEFPENLKTVLNTILASEVSNAVKISRLKDLEVGTSEYVNQHNSNIRSIPTVMMAVGAGVGMLGFLFFARTEYGHNQIDFIIIPALSMIQNMLTGLASGALVGGLAAIPLRVISDESLIDETTIDLVRVACQTVLANDSGNL